MNQDFWDEKYHSDFTYGTEPNAFLASQAEFLSGLERAFVPGDGEGRNGVWLAERGLQVTTLDLSAVGVSAARQLATQRNVEIDARHGDLAEFDWPDAPEWDLVVAIWLHLPPPLREAVHRALWAGVRPGGLVLIEAYRPDHIRYRETYGSVGGPPGAPPMLTRAILLEEFAEGEFELLEDADVHLSEGNGHQGRSATIRARIRKPG